MDRAPILWRIKNGLVAFVRVILTKRSTASRAPFDVDEDVLIAFVKEKLRIIMEETEN